jgi:hypothetical protein
MRFQPSMGLQDHHRVVPAQPAEIQPIQQNGKLRTGRHIGQPFRNHLPLDNHSAKLTTTTDKTSRT